MPKRNMLLTVPWGFVQLIFVRLMSTYWHPSRDTRHLRLPLLRPHLPLGRRLRPRLTVRRLATLHSTRRRQALLPQQTLRLMLHIGQFISLPSRIYYAHILIWGSGPHTATMSTLLSSRNGRQVNNSNTLSITLRKDTTRLRMLQLHPSQPMQLPLHRHRRPDFTSAGSGLLLRSVGGLFS